MIGERAPEPGGATRAPSVGGWRREGAKWVLYRREGGGGGTLHEMRRGGGGR